MLNIKIIYLHFFPSRNTNLTKKMWSKGNVLSIKTLRKSNGWNGRGNRPKGASSPKATGNPEDHSGND